MSFLSSCYCAIVIQRSFDDHARLVVTAQCDKSNGVIMLFVHVLFTLNFGVPLVPQLLFAFVDKSSHQACVIFYVASVIREHRLVLLYAILLEILSILSM